MPSASPNVTAAVQYAYERLQHELRAEFSYHSLGHTFDDVLPNALRLADLAGVDDEDRLLLQTAAAFHDIGYPIDPDDHEAIGAQIASETLPKLGYTGEQIGRIQQMIRATKVPQSPQTLLDQLLCDADLDVLGRPDFAQRNHDLRDEMAARDEPSTLLSWYEGQHRFISNHRYHTSFARETRLAGKNANLALLNEWLLNLRLAAFMPRDLRERALSAPTPSPSPATGKGSSTILESATPSTGDEAIKSARPTVQPKDRNFNQPVSPLPLMGEGSGVRVGAALFADIAGFTKLTEQLLEQYGAERGAEAVLQAINPLYDAIIPVLYQFNGSVVDMQGSALNSVIGFAGDSITCWLNGDDGSERAVACAFAMQAAMEDQTVTLADGSQQKMQLKIGVASGKVRRMQVGDPEIGLYDVLAGATVANMATAADLANSAEIILCPQTTKQLSHQLTIEPRPDGYARAIRYNGAITPQPIAESAKLVDADIARQWVLAPVADRIASGGYLAELRPAAALFMRFHGLDYDHDDDSGHKLDQFIRWVQTILQRTSGYLIQLSVGDKGSYLYAAFGAPLSFAGNARRAATAALALRNAPQRFGFIEAVGIGISQGRMWTGAYGSQSRSTYGVISRATNLAARLMESAETTASQTQILVHESVVGELEDFKLAPLPNQIVKGFDEPQKVWELISLEQAQTALPHFNRPLIGRDALLSKLVGDWSIVHSRQGRAVALIGEAGIGKSHLAATFARDIETFGGRVYWSRADQTRRDLFYDVWRQLFVGLFNLTSEQLALAPSALLSWLEQSIASGQFANDERLPLLGDLLGIALPDNQTTAAYEPAVRRESLFALLLALLASYSDQPLCLVIDDAHLLDDASSPFLLRVLQSMESWSLLLALVRRPPEDDLAAWQMLADQPILHTLPVEALSQNALTILIDHQLAAPPSHLLAELAQRQTHGNPFYLESLIETLHDDGKIVHQQSNGQPVWEVSDDLLETLQSANCVQLVEGHWQLNPTADLAAVRLGLPDSVHRSVLTRIDRLPEATKLVLKIASVIGQQFEISLLTASHPQASEGSILHPHLEHLTVRNLIRQLDDKSYQFQHHATQEVTYNTLLFAQRQDLHRQVMQALLATSPNADVAIAQHSFEAQEWEIALPFLQKLGLRAQQLYANHQSVANYERVLLCLEALGLDQQGKQITAVRLALGESLIHLGRYGEALEHLAEARTLATADKDARTLAQAYRWTARAYELQGEYPEAIRWLEEGLAADQSESRESAELYLIAGLIESHRGNYDESQELCDNAIALAQHFDAPAILGRAYNLAGILALYRGQNDRAIAQFEQALTTYRGCNDRRGEALALNQLANANFDRGNWQAANEHYQAARAMFVETGDVYNRLLVDNNMGGIARNQRRLDAALQYYEAALRSLEQIGGSAYAKGALHMNRGNTQALRGELAAAQADLTESRQLLESAEVRVLLPELTRSEAVLALLQNDTVLAAQKAEQAISLARELNMRSEEGHALRVRGQIATAENAIALAKQNLNDSLAIMRESADLFGTAETLTQLVELQHNEDARKEAMAIYRQLGVEN